MSLQSPLPLTTITRHIRKLCQEKQTGNLYIIVNNRLQGRIGIQNGKIAALSFLGRDGLTALPLILDIQAASIIFKASPDLKSVSTIDLPSTHELLTYFDGIKMPMDDPAQTHPAPGNGLLSEATKTTLELTLKEFIGPIAKVLCNQHFRTVTTLTAAIDALAEEIPDLKAAIEFHELAHRRLY